MVAIRATKRDVMAGPTLADEGEGMPLSPVGSYGLSLIFPVGLFACGFLAAVRQDPGLVWSFHVAGSGLLAWGLVLFARAIRSGRTLTLVLASRKQHYLQACAQGSFLLYWGWYWPQVYDSAVLIAAQVIFAYGFDILLGWSRREHYRLGFGPVPVVFSINLFLWFVNDLFYLQFLLVGVAFAAKELIQWDKEGRRTHVFNPAAFALAVFSLVLILTETSHVTWGQNIAISQFYPPYVYLMVFVIGLPGQLFFGVASMTLSAVAVTYLFGLLYFSATGVYYFYDSYIPIAVFLGMHLLSTDPSTSPRTELGRILFGILYGLGTVTLYGLLGRADTPTFYDKLLVVPFLNLGIKWIDHAARSKVLRGLDPEALGRALAPRQRHAAYMSVWAILFAVMSTTQGVGDYHPGQWLPFWQRACADQRPHSCEYLAARQSSHCTAGSGWSCNELGVLLGTPGGDRIEAAAAFEQGCALEFTQACGNLLRILDGETASERAPPMPSDWPIVLRGSKGTTLDRELSALYSRACDQGWPDTCGNLDRRQE